MATNKRRHVTNLHLWEHLTSLHLLSQYVGSTRRLWQNMCRQRPPLLCNADHLIKIKKIHNCPRPSVQFSRVLPRQRHLALLMSEKGIKALVFWGIQQWSINVLIYGLIKQQKGLSNKRHVASPESFSMQERLLHPPDILVTMNVDLMKLVLQMFVFYVGHIIYHFQDYKAW